jgi:hypothetical protein
MSTPTRQDTAEGRFYSVGAAKYPSVTTILGAISKPALVNWAANQERTLVLAAAADLNDELSALETAVVPMSRSVYLSTLDAKCGQQRAHAKLLEKAGDIGTQAHALVEAWCRARLGVTDAPKAPDACDEARRAFAAFEAWAVSVDLQPILIEERIVSRRHGYAGTVDLLALVKGVTTVVDFKTGKSIYGEAHLQNVAYQVAVEEMGLAIPDAGLIVRLPKAASDPDFEVAEVPSVDELLPVFLAVRRLWEWQSAEQRAYWAKTKRSKAS